MAKVLQSRLPSYESVDIGPHIDSTGLQQIITRAFLQNPGGARVNNPQSIHSSKHFSNADILFQSNLNQLRSTAHTDTAPLSPVPSQGDQTCDTSVPHHDPSSPPIKSRTMTSVV